LELHFAEAYFKATSLYGGPGPRVFDIYAEYHQQLESNFDIMAEVPSKTALIKEYIVNVNDDTLDISFTKVTNYPKL
jgi:hypothetical protein